MHSAEVVVREPERHSRRVILNLLGESVGQASETLPQPYPSSSADTRNARASGEVGRAVYCRKRVGDGVRRLRGDPSNIPGGSDMA
jgi:hypothetical protein